MAEKTADSFGVQLAKLLWPKLKKNCCQVTRLQYAAFPFSNFLFMRSFNLPHTLVAKSSKTQNSPCRLFERSYLSKSFGIVLRSLVHPIDFGAPRDGGNCSLPCRHVLHGVASGLQENVWHTWGSSVNAVSLLSATLWPFTLSGELSLVVGHLCEKQIKIPFTLETRSQVYKSWYAVDAWWGWYDSHDSGDPHDWSHQFLRKVYWVSFDESSSQRSSTELKVQPLKGTIEGTGLPQLDLGIRHWHPCCWWFRNTTNHLGCRV